MRKYLLLTPGPVNVKENVRLAANKEDICHRGFDFSLLLQRVEHKLLKIFEIKNTSKYRAVVITGSGTAANESILSSVVGDKNILILSNGEFGERLLDVSKIYNKNTFFLKFKWGERFDLKKIESYLKHNNIDILMTVHHETSSGMLNPLEKIGKIAKKYGALLIVDCVSSAGAEKIDMDKYQIAFCSGSSSKAISSYPGLSFVVGKSKEFEKLKKIPAKTGYLNLYKFYYFIKQFSQTPNTPAVPLFYALEQALDNILNTGSFNHCLAIQKKANALREGMLALGLTFLIDQKDMSSVLTTVHCPEHVNLDDFQKKLHEKSIIIYEGKGHLKGKVFQVGNIGELNTHDIQFFLTTLKSILLAPNRVNTKTTDLIKNTAPLITLINKPINHGPFKEIFT